MSPIPSDDAQRVALLRELRLLDGAGRASFDEVVELVTMTIGSSIATISLIDEQRQWFLASRGLNIKETRRERTFCNDTVALGRPLLVMDTLTDQRYSNSSLTCQGPRIRSYLGCPIRSPDGHILGALCAADPSEGKFDNSQTALIAKLAALVERLIETHVVSLKLGSVEAELAANEIKQKRAELILRQMERIAKIGTWMFDDVRVRWSDGTCAIHGVPPGSEINKMNYLDYVVPEHREIVGQVLQKAVDDHTEVEFKADIIAHDGQRKHIHVIGERYEGEQVPTCMMGVLTDITEHHQALLALKRAAEVDELTGLLNRNGFVAPLEDAVRRYGAGDLGLFLLMFDLDGLKDTNDIYGHVVGDVALQEIASRMRTLVPPEQPVARWGGDEFAVALLGDMTRETVREIAVQIVEAIARTIKLPGKTIYLRAACGVAECDAGINSKELVRRASQALYYSKTMGPGGVHFYDRSFEERSQARMAAEREVRSALETGRIFASYQPIVDLHSGAVNGYEALLRISTRQGKEIKAAQLLPGLVDPELSRMVAARMTTLVASEFSGLAEGGSLPGFVSINATEADLLSNDYPDMLLDTLARFNVPPDRITLEVTETMLLVNDMERVKDVLDRVKAAGVSIALDDFGTGFSSLTHLKLFPIDKVKIDRSFICDITENRNAQSIVAAVIAMAQRLSIGVIAEGIEDEKQLDLLRRMDCPMGQGFLFSPPKRISAGSAPPTAGAPEAHQKRTKLST